MIVTKDFPNRSFASKEELFKELRANKEELIAVKMATDKQADSINYTPSFNFKQSANKEQGTVSEDVNKIIVKAVINSCGILDSHSDVHIPGSWTKTAKETKNSPHLDSHKRNFQDVISTDTKWSVETINVKGVDLECLVMTSTIDKKRNEFMFNQYKNGYVKEHSVGMRYVRNKLYLCINSESKYDVEEKENWDKYIDFVVNREDAEAQGYFWAVVESKAIEGSAVVFGSNSFTPTEEVTEIKEPLQDTQNENKQEPTEVTQEQAIETIKNYFKLN